MSLLQNCMLILTALVGRLVFADMYCLAVRMSHLNVAPTILAEIIVILWRILQSKLNNGDVFGKM